jgi:hypothetical protein
METNVYENNAFPVKLEVPEVTRKIRLLDIGAVQSRCRIELADFGFPQAGEMPGPATKRVAHEYGATK